MSDIIDITLMLITIVVTILMFVIINVSPNRLQVDQIFNNSKNLNKIKTLKKTYSTAPESFVIENLEGF